MLFTAAAAASMASTRRPVGARTLLACASLLAAMGLGVPESAEPVGTHARPQPPGAELPAPPANSPPVRRSRAPHLPVPGGPKTVGKVAPLAAQCPTLGIRRSQGLCETQGWVDASSVPWLWRQNSTRPVGEIGKGVKCS